MPRLSDTMTEGVVATWLKKVGDKIEEGDILAEIETDKATMEFESFHEGTLLHIGIQEGETADVDTLLAIIGKEGEDFKSLLNQNEAKEAVSSKEQITETPIAEKESDNFEIPAGIDVVTMPRLSDTMTEGTVATWLKKVGDSVEEGDILAEIETDKATMEFESFHQGTLLYIGVEQGNTASVDAVLAIIGEKGTDVAPIVKALENKASTPVEVTDKEAAVTRPATTTQPIKTESKPQAITTPVNAASGRIVASPLAKKLAAEKNINLGHIQGTGEGGRIIKRDIENYTPGIASSANRPFVPAGQESFPKA